MKKILIEMNVILDMLNRRNDHAAAAELFDLCVRKKVKGFICPHEIAALLYSLESYRYRKPKRRRIVETLLDVFSSIPVTEKIMRAAIHSSIGKYEDALTDVSAQEQRVDFIVTRNLKDFKNSRTRCLLPSEALSQLRTS